MKKKINAAVIGVGYLGTFHAEKYSQLKDVNLIGVVDVDSDRAKAVADRFQTRSFTDYREIVRDAHAVSIVVPTDRHYEIAKECLERGCDVLIEKPMTEKIWQAENLIEIAKSKGAILQVGHLERFNSAIQGASRFLSAPLFIECHRLHSFVERGTDVDVILDLMIHDLDIILSLVRSRVVRIDAIGTPVLSPYIDIANVRLKFESGCVANVTASRVSFSAIRKIRIFQPSAYVSIDFQASSVDIFRKISPKEKEAELTAERLSFAKGDALSEEISQFIESVKRRTPPLVGGVQAIEALKLADQIHQQIKKTGRGRGFGRAKYSGTWDAGFFGN
jgi:predicted dehydrogenase